MRPALYLLALTLGVSFAAPARAVECSTCQRDLDDEFLFCPFDGTALAEPVCPACDRAMTRGWRFCPFDGVRLVSSRAKAAGPAARKEAAPPAPEPPAEAAEGEAAAPPPAAAVAKTEDAPRRGSPMHTIDRLFRAIENADERALDDLYLWGRFFPKADAASLGDERDKYVKRLLETARPTIHGRERVWQQVKLGKSDASIQVALRDPESRVVEQVYDFQLAYQDGIWRITAIRP